MSDDNKPMPWTAGGAKPTVPSSGLTRYPLPDDKNSDSQPEKTPTKTPPIFHQKPPVAPAAPPISAAPPSAAPPSAAPPPVAPPSAAPPPVAPPSSTPIEAPQPAVGVQPAPSVIRPPNNGPSRPRTAPIPSEPAPAPSVRFDSQGSFRLGIIGGKGTGKSYLFQAIAFRVSDNQDRAGALQPFMRRARISAMSSAGLNAAGNIVGMNSLVGKYREWRRLDFTKLDTQSWYRLQMELRTGWLGRSRTTLAVDFFDASGEDLAFNPGHGNAQNISTEGLKKMNPDALQTMRKVYDVYAEATVMVFCLPARAAFPCADQMTPEELDTIETNIKQFHQVVANYEEARERKRKLGTVQSVQTILALTMSDDPLCSLHEIREKWIEPFTRSARARQLHQQLASHGGVARYLDNARCISELVTTQFENSEFHPVRQIPGLLEFGGGSPWIIPMSAINGTRLEKIIAERKRARKEGRPLPPAGRLGDPNPAHVELPMLLALCERFNALA